MPPENDIIDLLNAEVKEIADACAAVIANEKLTLQQQQERYELIQKRKIALESQISNFQIQDSITNEDEEGLKQALMRATYKLAIRIELESIAAACADAITNKELTPQQQQANYDLIQKHKIEFVKSLAEYCDKGIITLPEEQALTQALIYTIYDLEKIATRQSFGITLQPEHLPTDIITSKSLTSDDGAAIVASANQTATARLNNGTKVFSKNTKPDVAQLEIVAADFFRQTLGKSRTSHGKIIIDKEAITGMYIEAIPGFISMRELTDLAKDPNADKIIQQKIDDLNSDIETLKKDKSTSTNQAKLKGKRNLLGAYTKVRELGLIDTKNKRVDISKIPQIISKALCSAFYYEDWDRHKDNFGISYDEDSKDKELGVASLDYDKSLTGTFQQDKKSFDWNMTPERLRDFPLFNSWYWPTQDNESRKTLAYLAGIFKSSFLKKIPKMYSAEEAAQYASLKDNPGFQRQSHIEWLKLIFTPKDLRQLVVDKLASPDQQQLQSIPATLEIKRQALLNAAIQLNNFRERLSKEPKVLDEVKEELRTNLSPTEFAIVEKNWTATLKEITDKAARVTAYEEIAGKLGCHQLLEAIKRTGISFSPTPPLSDIEFRTKLTEIIALASKESSKSLSDKLNKKFGLSISEADARKIKQEAYVNKIREFAPHLADTLTKGLAGKIKKLHASLSFSNLFTKERTLNSIKELGLTLKALAKTGGDNESNLKKAIECLRDLGVSKSDISDDDLKKAIKADYPRPTVTSRQKWVTHRDSESPTASPSGEGNKPPTPKVTPT